MPTRPFEDHFSGHADAYARYRPDYPRELFAWLAEIAPARDRAWDCATGNGQAAVVLADFFAEVIATDASEKQLRNAFPHPRVSYRAAPADASGIESASVDLLTVAQAVHWFNGEPFYREAERVLKPGGVLAVWAYALFRSTPEVDAVVHHLYREVVGPYWPEGRGAIDRGYVDVVLPLDAVEAPAFAMEKAWTADDALGYLGTWSATQGFIAAHGHDPVATVADDLRRAWGPGERTARWPLLLKVARKPS